MGTPIGIDAGALPPYAFSRSASTRRQDPGTGTLSSKEPPPHDAIFLGTSEMEVRLAFAGHTSKWERELMSSAGDVREEGAVVLTDSINSLTWVLNKLEWVLIVAGLLLVGWGIRTSHWILAAVMLFVVVAIGFAYYLLREEEHTRD